MRLSSTNGAKVLAHLLTLLLHVPVGAVPQKLEPINATLQSTKTNKSKSKICKGKEGKEGKV